MLASSGSSNFIVPNATFFVELIIFIVVLGIVAKFVLPSIQKVMRDRDELVRKEQDSAESARREAARLDAERLQTLGDARARAREILQEASRQVDDLLQDARARGQQEHDRRVQQASGGIDAERDRLRAELLERAETLVVQAAERIVGGGLHSGRHRGLIAEELALADAARPAERETTVIVAASSNFGISYLLEWVAIALFVAFIWRYIVPPLRRAMNRQTDTIRDQLSTGERLREESEQLLEGRRAMLERAQAEAESIVAQAERNAVALLEQGRQRADLEYAHALARASSAIELARAQIRDEVLEEIGSVVVAAAARIVAAELDEPVHHRLIAEAIAAAESERSL